MSATWTFVFYLLAAICFFLAWLSPHMPEVGRLNPEPLGLLFLVIPWLVTAADNMHT
jgi:hypothetical protein